MRPKAIAALGLLLCAACAAHAGIYYDDSAECIRVVDFPQEAPCTLGRLLQMDRLYGWEMVTWDQERDAYTIAANLCIGSNDGTDTWFQIGGAQRPRETLIMQGNLVVYPYWIEGENRGEHYSAVPRTVNRLTIGVPGDDSVTAALKFHDQNEAGSSLFLGRIPGPEGTVRQGHGGQLHVHHGVITSATPRPGGEFGATTAVGGMSLTGDSVVLDHATLSWISGAATYGMSHNATVRHSVFEHLGTAMINGKQDLVGCTFRNCETAVRDYGSLDAVLTDCVFEGNEHNWTLTYTDKGLVCIDCTWDQPREGNLYRSWENPRTAQVQYPSFVSKRHIVVEVIDDAGEPVPEALVTVRCEQETPELTVENATQQTDELGRTPGEGEDGAILLVEVVKRATDVENQPEVAEFSYTIEATAEGLAPGVVEHFRPAESWDVVRIVLGKR